MDSSNLKIAALGRPFTLGMLYDARRDALIPGSTFWDEEALQEKTVKIPQPGSAFGISPSDSIESKCSLLDVGNSLKANFLSGLVKVGGSAKYLNDMKNSMNQSRVTVQYQASSCHKTLSWTNQETMNTQQLVLIRQSSATHVVTAIQYGANAFFVFDSENLEASRVQDRQDRMEAMIQKIPSFNGEDKVKIKLSDEEKALTEQFTCTFYGDFTLDSNPATFDAAVKTFAELPKLMGENGENSVPIGVWLTPLKFFIDFPKPDLPDVEKIKDRRELISYACNLTLDPDTAHKSLHLSEGNKKATSGAQQTDLPDHPERFDSHPQVLCNQSLEGQHYWEAEFGDSPEEYIYLAVAYKKVTRKGSGNKGDFGLNTESWSFGRTLSAKKFVLRAYQVTKLKQMETSIVYKKIGVFLDWPAGTLSFYTVSSNTLSHLYTFRDIKFTEPVYPGFWIRNEGNYVNLNLSIE